MQANDSSSGVVSDEQCAISDSLWAASSPECVTSTTCMQTRQHINASEINMVSLAEVTSYNSRCSESSAFRRLGAARLCPMSSRVSSAWRSDTDNVHYTTGRTQLRDNELLQETTESEETTEDSGAFDCTPPYTAANRRNDTASASLSFDRIANVSVHFPCSPASAELARKLRTAQKNNRRLATTNTTSFTSHHSSLDAGNQTTSFDVLPDCLVTRVFASGLDSYDLCRCGLVCRRWNALVWNAGGLWTTIDFGCREGLDVDSALRALTRALSRSTPQLCLGVEALLLGNCRRLTDDGLRTVARRCVDLRRLDVSWCALITNTAMVDVLTRCVNLQHLDITGCTLVTCVGVKQDVRTSSQLHLSRLDASDCVRLSDCGLRQIVSICRRLTCLYVRRCTLITDAGLQLVATHCHALTDISVAECTRVTDAGIVLLAVHLGQSLAHLSVARCPLVGDRAMACLADRCRRLRYVNARGCGGVTDRGVTSLATSRRLRALDVSDCVGVSDVALRALALCCGARLGRLGVRGCPAVSDHGVLALAQHCTQLRQLNVQDCSLVSTGALTALRYHCKNCVIQHNCIDFY